MRYGQMMFRSRSSGGGGGSPTLQLIASSYSSTNEGGAATSSFALANTGVATGLDTVDSGNGNYSWLTGGSAGDYEVQVTPTSGTFTTGTTGTWISLGTNRAWTVTRSTLGVKSCTATYEIRAAADPGVILVSASIQITAQVT